MKIHSEVTNLVVILYILPIIAYDDNTAAYRATCDKYLKASYNSTTTGRFGT